MSNKPHVITLACHPLTPSVAVRAIQARVRRMPDGLLDVSYVLEGDLHRLRIPAPTRPRVSDRLWQHTCCEIFIARRGLPAYHEFNFSPSGEWAVYSFERYREDAPRVANLALDPRIAVRGSAGKLELDASIRLDRLSPIHRSTDLALALSAVVEDTQGALSYWALDHPPGKPDFHHSAGFTLMLAENRDDHSDTENNQ